MTTTPQPTATIHPFPPRGRFAQPAPVNARNRIETWRPQFVAAESGWYHDEAVREDSGRKN